MMQKLKRSFWEGREDADIFWTSLQQLYILAEATLNAQSICHTCFNVTLSLHGNSACVYRPFTLLLLSSASSNVTYKRPLHAILIIQKPQNHP